MANSHKRKRRLGIRERLGRLTYRGACGLLAEGEEGARRLRRGGAFDVDLGGDLRLDAESLTVCIRDPDLRASATVTAVERVNEPKGLRFSCDRCDADDCDHVAAVLTTVLEEKQALGLAAPPDPDDPVEHLTEDELLRRAYADREERAAAEKMLLRAVDPRTPWTDYSITSRNSGKTYRVSLRGLDAGASYCSCPDYRKNHLGTCKHVIAAHAKVRKRFPVAVLAKPYRRRNFSLRLDYGATIGLRFNVPSRPAADARRILGRLTHAASDDVGRVVTRLRRLERAGHAVHVYPDAEEFIEQRLLTDRLRKVTAEIRRDPQAHPLRTELLDAELLPYQLDGIAFAVGAGRAILADDMGLGKTIQGIGVAELLARLADIRRVLVVCPASLKSQWRAEIARFSARTSRLVVGSAEERARQYPGDAFFTICNYEQILRDHPVVERTQWDLIVLDEGQRIKNWESQTARVVGALRSRFALVLSGTPLENRLEELYSVVGFIDDRRLGPAYRFLHTHRIVDPRGRVEGYRNLSRLRRTLEPVLLRRTRASVMGELPERTTEILRIEPTDEQAAMSDEYTAQAARIAAKPHLTEIDLLRLQKCLLMARLACDSTFLVDKQAPGYSSKLARLAELFVQFANEPDRKIIVFSEWTRMLDLIEPLLVDAGLEFVRLDGSVPQKRRPGAVARFQEDERCRVILMSNAGATGLNLQAADTIVNVDLPWNPAVLEQRIARAHRMGQTRPVHVYLLVTEGTFEERLLATLSAKHDLALAALDIDSDIDEVELHAGIDELKRRLERLLAEEPAPVDESERHRIAAVNRAIAERRDRVAAAGGELLGAAVNLLGELTAGTTAPPSDLVERIRAGLDECTQPSDDGRLELRLTLDGKDAIARLATSLASLLAADPSASRTA